MGAAKRFTRNPGNSAIAYYRYSSDAQRDASIEQQREEAHEYAEKRGFEIIKEYEDHAISGTRDDRPEFQRMLYEAGQIRPAYLIIWKTDRLSRDKIDMAIAKGRLRDSGVEICYVAESLPDDDEATRIMLESLYEGMAAAFIASHRKNVLRGLNYNAENALYNGRKIFGYTGKPNSRYEVDEKTAVIVRKIYGDYADGMPLQKIVDELKGSGITTGKGNAFTINSLRHILQNRCYIGEYKWGETVIPDGMPAIISQELFDAVQKRFEQNKVSERTTMRKMSTPDGSDYWLTGHLYCGKCHESMQGVSGTSRHGYKAYYYYCKGHRKKTCDLGNKRKEDVERIVLFILDELLNDPTLRMLLSQRCYEEYMLEQEDMGPYITSLEARIKETNAKIDNIIKAVEDGFYSKKLQEKTAILEDQLEMLNTELEKAKVKEKYQLKPEDITRYFYSFVGSLGDKNKRNILLDTLIDKIYVYDDEIAVTFTYTEDRRSLNIKDTQELMDIRQDIMDMMGVYMDKSGMTPDEVKEYLGVSDEDPPDFFRSGVRR